jgi:hypothetical protein
VTLGVDPHVIRTDYTVAAGTGREALDFHAPDGEAILSAAGHYGHQGTDDYLPIVVNEFWPQSMAGDPEVGPPTYVSFVIQKGGAGVQTYVTLLVTCVKVV